MKHKIKLGLYLTVGIVLVLCTRIPTLPVAKQFTLCVCGIVFMILAINQMLDYLFDTADEWKAQTDKEKSNKGDKDA